MKKLVFFVCIITICAGAVSAQSETDGVQNEVQKPFAQSAHKVNQTGDKYVNINIDFEIPLVKNMNFGGAGMIGFSVFLLDSFSVGGEIAFSFMSTIGENMFYYVPVMAKATYVFSLSRFEFPISLGAGFAFQSYTNRTYYGFAFKPEIGAYFRYSPEWSFGVAAGCTLLPQFYKNSEYNKLGTILDIAASVKYHF